jgi:hypothetical protein
MASVHLASPSLRITPSARLQDSKKAKCSALRVFMVVYVLPHAGQDAGGFCLVSTYSKLKKTAHHGSVSDNDDTDAFFSRRDILLEVVRRSGGEK